ncbi:hypothetical protein GCM10022286_03380 [Gryllotalpicola daejeonensis]|uniref:Protein-glutamine gamma-glutamyltransferase-like C-terminal domain-containing protein n=1 Tax=Gryllotalpicola daejeonensis TaxID=993087 RepID=A0ABP7ZEA7_9MICO
MLAGVALAGVPRFGPQRWRLGLFGGALPHHDFQAPSLPPMPPHHGGMSSSWPLILLVVIAAAAAVAFWLVLRAVLRTRRGRGLPPALSQTELEPPALTADAGPDDEGEPDAPIVHRGLRLALDVLDEQREPADAIVKAWLGLQSAAEDSGVERRAAETPTEFTRRVITRVQADAAAAQQLVDVYQAVRFGAHEITAADVRAARTAVERMLSSWHEPILRSRR